MLSVGAWQDWCVGFRIKIILAIELLPRRVKHDPLHQHTPHTHTQLTICKLAHGWELHCKTAPIQTRLASSPIPVVRVQSPDMESTLAGL